MTSASMMTANTAHAVAGPINADTASASSAAQAMTASVLP
jgi:hypothetical protein